MSAFLSPPDVERLTGYKRARDQLAWLKRAGLRAWRNAQGEVIVPLVEVEGRKREAASWEPRWEGMDGSQAHRTP